LNTDPHLVWVDTGGIVLLKEVLLRWASRFSSIFTLSAYQNYFL